MTEWLTVFWTEKFLPHSPCWWPASRSWDRWWTCCGWKRWRRRSVRRGWRSCPGLPPSVATQEPLNTQVKVKTSVADSDPDPHVFGPPGSGSTSQRYRSGSYSRSGSGSFYHHAKIVRKTLIPTILWLFLFLSLKNDVNVASKSKKQKKLC